MKCTRRPDVEPRTRIQIVMQAWLHQGVYGKMTEIAKHYRASITVSATPKVPFHQGQAPRYMA